MDHRRHLKRNKNALVRRKWEPGMVPYTPTIPAPRRLEDCHEFKDSLDSLRESNSRGKATGTTKWENNLPNHYKKTPPVKSLVINTLTYQNEQRAHISNIHLYFKCLA